MQVIICRRVVVDVFCSAMCTVVTVSRKVCALLIVHNILAGRRVVVATHMCRHIFKPHTVTVDSS